MPSTAPPPSEASEAAEAARAVVARLSREDKLRIVSGADFWHTSALDEHGVRSITLTDGPHGLRKQRGSGDHVGLADSVPATCFPTAVALGSTLGRRAGRGGRPGPGPGGARRGRRRCSWARA